MSSKGFPLFACLALALLSTVSCRNDALRTIDVRLKGRTIRLEVALTEREKERGLMERRSLGPDEGMIFVYDRDRRMYFWMKDTYLPLSVAFLSADGTILQIEDMRPFDQKTIESRQSARYAVEVNRGAFTRWGAGVGDKFEFPPSFPPIPPPEDAVPPDR